MSSILIQKHHIGHLYALVGKCDGGITVSIAAFQAVDPGSTPGHRNPLYCINRHFYSIIMQRSNILAYSEPNDVERGNQGFKYKVKYIVLEAVGYLSTY